MATSRLKRSYSLAAKQQHLVNWKKSGLSMSAYCRQHDIRVSSLSLWNKNKRQPDVLTLKPVALKASSSPTMEKPTWTTSLATTQATSPMIEIVIANHMILRLPMSGLSPIELAKFVRALSQCN